MKKKITIIGAGPGGLSCAMILARRGYDVTVFEKEKTVGGRNAAIRLGGYTFDMGPTFLMMTFILREVFQEAGRSLDDYCKIIPLDPMYKLMFNDRTIFPTTDHERMQKQVDAHFPGNAGGVFAFLTKEKKRYSMMYPSLRRPYNSPLSLLSWPLIRAVPYLSLGKTLYDTLGSYFNSEQLRLSFTFQAKYLGMSPWECPALFTMIPYVEHAFGIDHVEGGLSRISDAMAEVCKENGAVIHCSTPVKKIIAERGVARGVILENGEVFHSDGVVINADFGYAMAHLFDAGVIRKWTPQTLNKKKYSCSTFMLYLGIDKLYAEPHHQIIFAGDYVTNVNDIFSHRPPSKDMSVYIRNASATDPTIAPKNHSALYVLVPVPNTKSGTQWTTEYTRQYRDSVIKRIEERTSMKDLSAHIREEKVITPDLWCREYNLFLGATFNLGHTLRQMLFLRPRNRFEEVKSCYLVGGGTHPGSGLPTIYESARISADLIGKDIR